MQTRIFSFPPVAGETPGILILGTMPSIESLRQGFYYGHPRNAFWPIIAMVFGETPPVSEEEKRAIILRHDLALWDVAHSCERAGSLDSAIRSAQPNDVKGFLREHPTVLRILLNGGTAMSMFGRYMDGAEKAHECILMPSTSPAYTISFEKKLEKWREALIL